MNEILPSWLMSISAEVKGLEPQNAQNQPRPETIAATTNTKSATPDQVMMRRVLRLTVLRSNAN